MLKKTQGFLTDWALALLIGAFAVAARELALNLAWGAWTMIKGAFMYLATILLCLLLMYAVASLVITIPTWIAKVLGWLWAIGIVGVFLYGTYDVGKSRRSERAG